MQRYVIEVRNRNTKDWEVQQSGDAESRRKFLKANKELRPINRQWRCRKEN